MKSLENGVKNEENSDDEGEVKDEKVSEVSRLSNGISVNSNGIDKKEGGDAVKSSDKVKKEPLSLEEMLAKKKAEEAAITKVI